MRSSNFILNARDGLEIFVFRWLPEGDPRGVVQIAHGLAEHAARYARLAEALTEAGFAVYANDHRGHGHTAKKSEDVGFLGEREGWSRCIDDLWLLNRAIAKEHAATPIIILGHSMGSTMAAQLMEDHGDVLTGVVLSGPSGMPTWLASLGRTIARMERMRLGRRGHSRLIQGLTFDSFNKRFAPARTAFDWLSRDPVEVDRYVADARCGFQASVQTWLELLGAWMEISRPENIARIPKQLPVYIIAGERDPVSGGCRQIRPMLDVYRAAGLQNVQHRFYPDARHELFNETSRREVINDLVSWLKTVVKH